MDRRMYFLRFVLQMMFFSCVWFLVASLAIAIGAASYSVFVPVAGSTYDYFFNFGEENLNFILVYYPVSSESGIFDSLYYSGISEDVLERIRSIEGVREVYAFKTINGYIELRSFGRGVMDESPRALLACPIMVVNRDFINKFPLLEIEGNAGGNMSVIANEYFVKQMMGDSIVLGTDKRLSELRIGDTLPFVFYYSDTPINEVVMEHPTNWTAYIRKISVSLTVTGFITSHSNLYVGGASFIVSEDTAEEIFKKLGINDVPNKWTFLIIKASSLKYISDVSDEVSKLLPRTQVLSLGGIAKKYLNLLSSVHEQNILIGYVSLAFSIALVSFVRVLDVIRNKRAVLILQALGWGLKELAVINVAYSVLLGIIGFLLSIPIAMCAINVAIPSSLTTIDTGINASVHASIDPASIYIASGLPHALFVALMSSIASGIVSLALTSKLLIEEVVI